jgi:hypothetical protein
MVLTPLLESIVAGGVLRRARQLMPFTMGSCTTVAPICLVIAVVRTMASQFAACVIRFIYHEEVGFLKLMTQCDELVILKNMVILDQ